MFKFSSQIIPSQVLKKAEGKEGTETVEGSKVKEEKLEVAGGKCWRGKWQSVLKFTGEVFNQFPMKVIFATVKASQYISQRLGSCLSPSCLLWGSTQSSPLHSTTIGCRMKADFN